MTDHSELIARLEQLAFSYRLNNEVSTNCRQAIAALRELPTHLLDVHAIADERDTLASANAGLAKDAERYREARSGGVLSFIDEQLIDAAMEPKSKP